MLIRGHLGRIPDVRRKIPATIEIMPPIRADIKAAVLGSAFLNCHPIPIYHVNLGKNKPTTPRMTNRIGISVNKNIHISLQSLLI